MSFPLDSLIALLTSPSRQIRPPIYSLKQTKLRKRRVVRYAILYFVLFVVFICLIAGPLIASKHIQFGTIPQHLAQPTGLNNNDTFSSETGTAVHGGAATTGGGGGGGASPTTTGGSKFKYYI
jgi:1,3-beta-glucan synthase